MISEKNSFIGRLLSSVEVKLIVSWLLVVLATIVLDTNHTYWNSPAESAQLILRQTVLLGFFALGAAIIIISGGIDLSSGSVIAMSATVFGSLMIVLDPEGFKAGHVSTNAVIMSIAGTLLVGAMVGTLHAWLITSVGLPPFVATLATLVGLRSFGRGLTPALTGGKSQIDFPDIALRDRLKDVTSISILFVVFALILWFLMSRTVTGRHLQAMGGNEQAAKLSGIRTDRLKWLAYVIGAVSASIVGIISFADTGSAKPDIMARGYELNAIAASVIGGCSLQGGVGTIPGTILGCLFLRTIIDAVQKIVGAGADVYEGMIVGIVVVVAVTFSQRGSSQFGGKKYFSNAIGWSVIPTLGLLTGLSYLLFFGKREWYAPNQAYVIAGAVVVALVIRAFFETKSKASGQS
ncbi:MAG: ABC transporter permease [Planctomycetaceae bacterium]|jgi:ribose/xylose/arabinose/galactoside ABC-type transport system permease subunit|nr:ABC transporter permease [Planctomycetaceae bacterium]MCE2815021.1 ABC transporter permease [Planctomycetaceae bacterium]